MTCDGVFRQNRGGIVEDLDEMPLAVSDSLVNSLGFVSTRPIGWPVFPASISSSIRFPRRVGEAVG